MSLVSKPVKGWLDVNVKVTGPFATPGTLSVMARVGDITSNVGRATLVNSTDALEAVTLTLSAPFLSDCTSARVREAVQVLLDTVAVLEMLVVPSEMTSVTVGLVTVV